MALGSALAFATKRVLVPVEGMHRATAEPWIAATGPLRGIADSLHDLMLRSVYGSVRVGTAALGAAVDRQIPESTASDSAVAVVNGLWGDDLGSHEDRLGTDMAFRDREGRSLTIEEIGEDATQTGIRRMVILVHGFAHTERCWQAKASDPGLLDLLADHPAVHPLAIRYNTGLCIDDNGLLLSELIEDLRTNGVATIDSIALVGYSMGGLVIRAAAHAAGPAGHGWIDNLDDIVTIAAPHRGTPVEKLVHAASFGLDVAPATRPLAAFLNTRSEGVQGLRHGAMPDEPPESVAWHFVAGVITANPAHPVGAIIGDFVVRPVSGSGPSHIEPVNVAVVGGVHHIDLLHDTPVLDAVVNWLDPSCESKER